MLGVPMIMAVLPMLLISWPASVVLFIVGWILQFVGHYVFEHNTPVLLANPKNPLTYFAAIAFVADEYRRLLTGRSLVDPAQ